ncbi:MFS transporter [Nonomuraea sp. KM88]|uniref:MFS transporter n=1 Tax=Nonomuraea sp. KM88 TaxID=3457427 RepID=UPI003FCE4D36
MGNFVGPALGGLFAQFGGWRLAFVSMAVIAALCGLLVPRVLPRGDRGDVRAPVPVVSLLLVTAAAAAVSVAGVLSGAAAIAAGIAVALLLVAVFVAHERRSELRVFPRSTYRPGSPLKWLYLTLALLAFGVAVESFLPLFGQRLGGLAPAVAGFFGAAISLGWSATQLVSSSAVKERTIGRLRMLGPLLLALGFLVQGLLQRQDAPLWLVLVWVPVLFIAGAGVGLAYPHLSVAVMSSTQDPSEGERAAAAIATVTSLSIAFGTAVASALVNLGGSSMLDAARYMLFGFAIICAFGAVTARAASRTGSPASAGRPGS